MTVSKGIGRGKYERKKPPAETPGASSTKVPPQPGAGPLPPPTAKTLEEATLKAQAGDLQAQAEAARATTEKTPKKSKEYIQREAEFVSTVLPMSGVLLMLLCDRMPNPKPPTKLEQDMWNSACANAARRYYPTLEQYSEIGALVLAGVIIAVPRLVAPEPEKSEIVYDKKSDIGGGEDRKREDDASKTDQTKKPPDGDARPHE